MQTSAVNREKPFFKDIISRVLMLLKTKYLYCHKISRLKLGSIFITYSTSEPQNKINQTIYDVYFINKYGN